MIKYNSGKHSKKRLSLFYEDKICSSRLTRRLQLLGLANERGRLPPLFLPPLPLKTLQAPKKKGTFPSPRPVVTLTIPYLTSNNVLQARPFVRELLQQFVAQGLVTAEIAVQVDPLFSSGSTEGGSNNQKWYAEAVGPDGSVDLAASSSDFVLILFYVCFICRPLLRRRFSKDKILKK